MVVISAVEDVKQKISLLEAGANDHLVKPFHPDELLARIKVQLCTESSTTKRVHHGELTLDKEARLISIKGNLSL